LPADVDGRRPQRVARYFREKLGYSIQPAEFDRQDVQLVGARLSNVRDRRAAALYYRIHGRRFTVVVFDAPGIEQVDRVRLGDRELFYGQVGGYTVPVRRHAGLNYAFAGDVDRRTLLHLAATARVHR
jgi:anti-sigma factor RsiW